MITAIGVMVLLAACFVLYLEYVKAKAECAARDAENSQLRNDLHNAINAPKKKSRGVSGRIRLLVELHEANKRATAQLNPERITIDINDELLWDGVRDELAQRKARTENTTNNASATGEQQ